MQQVESILLVYSGVLIPCLVAFLLGYGLHRLVFRPRPGNSRVAAAFGVTWLVAGLAVLWWPTPLRERWFLWVAVVALAFLALWLWRTLDKERHGAQGRAGSFVPSDSELAAIEPRFFGLARQELSTNRNEDLWAKCLALADGNETTASALYVREHARHASASAVHTQASHNSSAPEPSARSLNSDRHLPLLAVLLVLVVAVVAATLLGRDDPFGIADGPATSGLKANDTAATATYDSCLEEQLRLREEEQRLLAMRGCLLADGATCRRDDYDAQLSRYTAAGSRWEGICAAFLDSAR